MPTPVPTKRWARTSAGTSKRPVAAASPARIAESLRRTTLGAHEAIRRTPRDPRALRGLLFEIVALEEQAERLGLWGLRPFLRSLRLRVEAVL